MSEWSDVEFAAPLSRPRKAQDFLPIMADMLTCWDFLSCGAAGGAALALYARYILGTPMDFSAAGPFWRDITFGSLIAALILRLPAERLNPRFHTVSHFVLAAERRCFLAFGVLIAVGLVTRATDDLARLWLLAWFGSFAVIVAATRLATGRYLHQLENSGSLREAVAVIGTQAARSRMAARISAEADVVALFGTDTDDTGFDDAEEMDQLLDMGRDGGVHSVIVAFDRDGQGQAARVIERLKSLPLQVAVCPDQDWEGAFTPRMRMLGGVPLTVVADRPIKHWDMLVKTVIDKTLAAILLVFFLPILIAIALAVVSSSPGPVLFRQTRRGWCGRDFVIFKFRTMRADRAAPVGQTVRDDPRCTRVGRFLRKHSLDELPQLWNVLRGDMSLVGPRPHAEALHDMDRAGREIVAEYAQRHRVKPGLTGLAQVNGARGAMTSHAQLRRRVDYDLSYIENWSLLLDLEILVRTLLCSSGESAF